MNFIDSHAHVTDKQFDADRADVIARAWDAGLEAIILIGSGEGITSNDRALALAESDSRFFVAVGVHPHDAHTKDNNWLPRIKTLAQHPKVVAIGEIGLDFFYKEFPRDQQMTVFRQQIELAHELHLPILIHDRDAHDDVWRIIQEVGVPPRGGIFHCFSGDVAMAEKGIAAGFLVSIAGIVTFKNARQLQEVVATLPLEHLVIETDCPYLAPVPHRGKRNEPAYVVHVAKKIAEIKGVDVETVARVTTKNARQFFQLSSKGISP